MKYLISFIIVLFAISCNSTDSVSNATYFGGQIINPKTNFVLLLKDDVVLDTINLDEENKFLQEYNSLNEGLYTFKHGSEFQYIFIEPQDSILVRLNTWDFDESLVFSGRGGNKNEYLINLFLQNEKEEKAVFYNQYFDLDEIKFEAKLDSIAKVREFVFNEFTENELGLSDGFVELTKVAIYYPLYRLKELYPYYYKNIQNLDSYPELSNQFLNYRNSVDLNKKELISFYPYQNYVINYMYNLGSQLKVKDSSKNNLTINTLNSIVENVEFEEFKNTLLKRVVLNDFLRSETSCMINDKVHTLFNENCTNESFKTQVNNLVNDSKAIENSKALPSFEIENYSNSTKDITSIIQNKNTLIYFWSTDYMTSEYLYNKIKNLEKTLPEVLFIGINMSDYNNVLSEPNLKKLNINKQFKLTETSEAHSFLTSQYPRVIIVNKDGIVENGFTFLDSKKLYQELYALK